MSSLTEQDIRVLHEALDDEYRSRATYDQVIADFGETQPFNNIREAEARHIKVLQALFVQHGLPVPENPWSGKVERYTSLQAACEAAITAEIANAAMYDRLLSTTRNPDIITVLRNLQQASKERHLPAFQRCVSRVEGAGGMAHGAKHRRGRGGLS